MRPERGSHGVKDHVRIVDRRAEARLRMTALIAPAAETGALESCTIIRGHARSRSATVGLPRTDENLTKGTSSR